jgi:hypothetical protein
MNIPRKLALPVRLIGCFLVAFLCVALMLWWWHHRYGVFDDWTMVHNFENAAQFSYASASMQGKGKPICGPNCVYMLLALHGINVNNHMISKYISSSPDGSSLAELKAALCAEGLSVVIRKCSIDELRGHFQSPLIAYLNFQEQNHYVVVVDVTADAVTFLDGTTGVKDTYNCEWLKGVWSGYVLIPDRDEMGLWEGYVALGLAVGFLGAYGYSCSQSKRRSA